MLDDLDRPVFKMLNNFDGKVRHLRVCPNRRDCRDCRQNQISHATHSQVATRDGGLHDLISTGDEQIFRVEMTIGQVGAQCELWISPQMVHDTMIAWMRDTREIHKVRLAKWESVR